MAGPTPILIGDLLRLAENSDYKCPECDAPAENLPGYPYRRIGVRHLLSCKFYRGLVLSFPALMERIRAEREVYE